MDKSALMAIPPNTTESPFERDVVFVAGNKKRQADENDVDDAGSGGGGNYFWSDPAASLTSGRDMGKKRKS